MGIQFNIIKANKTKEAKLNVRHTRQWTQNKTGSNTGINRQGGMTDWRDKRTKNTERWTREQKGKKHRDQDDKCINQTRQGTQTAMKTERPKRHEDLTGQSEGKRTQRQRTQTGNQRVINILKLDFKNSEELENNILGNQNIIYLML